jgi:hypothetical protein
MSPFGAGGLNPYAYCAGDPINRVDPTGHFWKALLGIALSIAGFALSAVTMGAATPMAIIGLTLAAASTVLGVAGIIVDEVAPESGIGGILGWASLATGVLSAGAGLGALGKSAAKFGSKLYKGLHQPLGPKVAPKAATIGSRPGNAVAGGSRGAAAGASSTDDVALKGNGPVKIKLAKRQNIKEGLSKSAQSEYDTFKNAIHNEGLDAVEASRKMGDPKLTLLEKKLNRFEVRIGGKDRVTFIAHAETSSSPPYIEILQVGGHT